MLHLDHITIAALTLEEGVAYAQDALGVAIPPGGAHPLMGTHNHLLRLGEGLFLEVIAPDPSSGPPARTRWFGLDDRAMRASLAPSPRLVTWVVRTTDIAASLAGVEGAAGPAVTVTRGALSWLISVPADGSMPFGGAFPTLIEWPAGPHPASRMGDHGCALKSFRVEHPQARRIGAMLAPHFTDPRVSIGEGMAPRFEAVIETPHGPRRLV
jgi:Glyoxalase-like domain